MSDARDRPPASSFERGLRVLIAICDRDQVRVEDLVSQLGLPASTVYRYLRPLRELGLVRESDGYYRVGSRLAGDGRGVSNETLACWPGRSWPSWPRDRRDGAADDPHRQSRTVPRRRWSRRIR